MFKCFKKIYDYKILEKIRVDIQAAIDQKNMENNVYLDNYCYRIAENNEYCFYVYRACRDGSGGHVLKQSKANPKKVWYFGRSHGKLACVFHNCLFQISPGLRESCSHYLYSTNIDSGKCIAYDWFGKNRIYAAIGGYGRFWCQDNVNKMYVDQNCLILEITRKKSTEFENIDVDKNLQQKDPYDLDIKYRIIASIYEGQINLEKQWNI